MSALTIISTTSQRKNHAAIACARYNADHNSVVVLDQGGGTVLEGYEEGQSWIRTKHDNLLAQLRTGCDLAIIDEYDYVVLLDDDVTYLTPIEPSGNSYRIRSKKNVPDDPDWRGALTYESLSFIDEHVDTWFPDSQSMLVVSSRLFFPKPNEVVPHFTPLGIERFPSVFNDHVVWKTSVLDEVLRVFDDLGVLNYSAGVDKAGALVNNILGYTVGRLQWIRATKFDITGNDDSTIYDFGNIPVDQRNVYRNQEDAKALFKLRPFIEESGLSFKASITKNGSLNSFTRTTGVSLDKMVADYVRGSEMKALI
jgi:hypothetical protein